MDKAKLTEQLKAEETFRSLVYDDATGAPIRERSVVRGHPTIGYGRALDIRGITRTEASYLLANDIDAAEVECRRFTFWAGLDDVRQRVLADMVFNMGFASMLGFHDTLRYLADGRYELAARAMEDSEWFHQVGSRAVKLVAMMRTGKDPV